MVIKVDLNKKLVEFKDFKSQNIIATGDLNYLNVESFALYFWIANAGSKIKIVE